jgi:hypothetical protein
VQFDPRMHAPEGSWVTWPWAYDALMAFIAGAATAAGVRVPMSALAWVAPAWVFVNAALFLGAAARLGLSLPARALAALVFALSPLTQGLHRVGMLDHHYVEYSFVLATLYCGLGWFRDLSSLRHAMMLGAVLGAAPAFHNGLFALQIPVLAALLWLWALRRPLDPRGVPAFGAVLVGTTALFLLPSEPFRQGAFSYYLQSWFHLYIAACTASLSVLASRLRASPGRAAVIAGAGLAMAAPILAQIALGGSFVFGTLAYLDDLEELISPLSKMAHGRVFDLTQGYTGLLWLLPLGIGSLVLRLRRHAEGAMLFFAAITVFGVLLLLQQQRLQYFGSFALILPLCLLFDDVRQGGAVRALGVAALIVAALLPGLQRLLQTYPAGGDFRYMLTRQIYPALRAACARHPGVVLADQDDGHYIRYHSDCSVIANNFVLTPQHVEKLRLSGALLAGSLGDALARAPYVRYILVRRGDNVLDDAGCGGLACPQNNGLRQELLAEKPPPGLRLIMEIRLPDREPLARLYEVSR